MMKQVKIFITNILKLIGIMYISISLKNILQILFGTLSNSDHDIKLYKLINLRDETYYSNLLTLKIILGYDFILLVILLYFWLYFLLYLIISLKGNKLWLQLFYPLIIYLITILVFDHFHPNILFIFIVIFLGYANWWMFKKWIK